MAQYMNERIPGVDIPNHLIEKIADAGEDKNAIARISIEIAADTIRGLRSVTKGIHVMAIGWEQHIPAMLEQSQS
jgi:methylenetetrahydrofolate reductase (NADPH)